MQLLNHHQIFNYTNSFILLVKCKEKGSNKCWSSERGLCSYRLNFCSFSTEHMQLLFLIMRQTSHSMPCDTLSENKKRESVAGAGTKKVESAKCEKLEKSLAIWMGQLNDKSGKSTDEVIKERVRWFQSALHYTPNTFLLCN